MNASQIYHNSQPKIHKHKIISTSITFFDLCFVAFCFGKLLLPVDAATALSTPFMNRMISSSSLSVSKSDLGEPSGDDVCVVVDEQDPDVH